MSTPKYITALMLVPKYLHRLNAHTPIHFPPQCQYLIPSLLQCHHLQYLIVNTFNNTIHTLREKFVIKVIDWTGG